MAIANETTLGTIVLAGDLAGGNNATMPQLTPTGVKAGEYVAPTVTVDAKGRLLYASSLSYVGVPCADVGECGIVKVGNNITATTTGGRTVLSLKKASATDYGVVRLGSGFSKGCCEIYVDFPIATTAELGVVKVGTGLSIDGSGTLSATVATPSISGVVSVPTANGLSVEAGVVSFTMGSIPDATTSSRGLVQVGTNISVTAGVISIPDATTAVKGAFRGDSSFTTIGGEISQSTIATASVRGLVIVGSGLGVTADGTLSRGAAGGDATSSSKGIIRVAAGDPLLTVSAGLLSKASTTATTSVFGLARPGTNISFDSGSATMSIPDCNPATSTKGIVRSANGSHITITAGVIDVGPNVLKKAGGNRFTAAQVVSPVSLTISSNTSIDMSAGNVFLLNITADATVTPTNMVSGGQYMFVITRPNASTVTFASQFKFSGISSLTPTPGAVDMITATAIGTDLICRTEQNFQ